MSPITFNCQLINLQSVHCKTQIKYFFRQGLVNLMSRCAPKETVWLTCSSLASLLVDGCVVWHGQVDSEVSVFPSVKKAHRSGFQTPQVSWD